MGRPKKFSREDVLEKALPVFWEHGYADTSLQDLEKATSVNKSGLYAEFEDKDDIYLATLRHYYANRGGKKILATEPLGWDNIEKFLNMVLIQQWGKTGCFAVNAIREFAVLPPEALKAVRENRLQLRRLVIKNIEAEQTRMSAEAIGDVVMTFFSGLCLEQNFKTLSGSPTRKIKDLMAIVRSL